MAKRVFNSKNMHRIHEHLDRLFNSRVSYCVSYQKDPKDSESYIAVVSEVSVSQ